MSNTHLGNKLGHELNDVGIVPKLPNQHDHLFHLNLSHVVFSKDVVDQPDCRKNQTNRNEVLVGAVDLVLNLRRESYRDLKASWSFSILLN
jgi:hypothetical protein